MLTERNIESREAGDLSPMTDQIRLNFGAAHYINLLSPVP